MTPAAPSPIRRQGPVLVPDATRVVARLFVPDEAMPGHHSRARGILDRVMALDDGAVAEALADLRLRFTSRHRDLHAVFERHFALMAPRMAAGEETPEDRRLLIGAYFTAEYATEGTALTNPSMVRHPDQSGLAQGEVRFVMSVRAVGEGHVSCIGFRTGVVDGDGTIRVDEPGPFLDVGEPLPTTFRQGPVWAQLEQLGAANETAAFVFDRLRDPFDKAALAAAIGQIDPRMRRYQPAQATIHWLEWIADNHYAVTFPAESRIDERVLTPVSPSESNGLEDARFTCVVEDDGQASYAATYTAYDGLHVVPQLLQTDDFRSFRISQLSGPAAKNKGMALFPRRVGGKYLGLSRYDRERSSITRSDDGLCWEDAVTLDKPLYPWELIQAGNCGPPIETERGWLVLTHGVGPMRTYGLGAVLLDLDVPSKVVGSTERPLLLPDDTERDGYVPNVVYSCGGLRHGDLVVIPYGFGDQRISFAIIDLPRLLDQLI